MTIQVDQLRQYIVRPVTQALGLWSQAAEDLLVGTALQESGLTYLHQLGTGPAIGPYQMEPATHDDIWKNFLTYRQDLARLVHTLELPNWLGGADAIEMHGNWYYATAMCRVHYYRVPSALPAPGDIAGYARYWKEHYNSVGGAGTVDQFVTKYKAANGL